MSISGYEIFETWIKSAKRLRSCTPFFHLPFNHIVHYAHETSDVKLTHICVLK